LTRKALKARIKFGGCDGIREMMPRTEEFSNNDSSLESEETTSYRAAIKL